VAKANAFSASRSNGFAVELEERIGQADGQDAIAARELLGDAFLHVGVDEGDISDLETEPRGELREDLLVARHLLRDEHFPHRPAGLRLRPQVGQELGRDEALQRLGQPLVGERGYRHVVGQT